MATEPAIRIRDLVKRYAGVNGDEGKLALKGVSFDVPEGQIFGLLGPNGAGKSTLINILAGLVMKTSGTADIWGFDIDRHPRNAKRSIGIVPQEIVFDPFFTPFEVLENQAGFYGVPRAQRQSEALLDAVRYALEQAGGTSSYFDHPEVDVGVALAATALLVVSGAIAGLTPALKAANVKPIEALRAD